MSLAYEIAAWMRDRVKAAGAGGIVVGLSGGVDSACVAGLAQKGLGNNAVVGVIMPCHSAPIDAEYGHLVANAFNLETITVDLTPVYDCLTGALPATDHGMAQANLKPRLRMTVLYYIANARNYLVGGSGNKSELAVGYFTKYGDGGIDMLPLGDLYKREVYDVARELGVPQVVLDRPPTAGLWPGQTDEEEMGLTYSALERALVALAGGGDREVDEATLIQVRQMVDGSTHKRALAPMFLKGSS